MEKAKKFARVIIRTMCQTASGMLIGAVALNEVQWGYVASAVALSGIVCGLMNVNILIGEEE